MPPAADVAALPLSCWLPLPPMMPPSCHFDSFGFTPPDGPPAPPRFRAAAPPAISPLSAAAMPLAFTPLPPLRSVPF